MPRSRRSASTLPKTPRRRPIRSPGEAADAAVTPPPAVHVLSVAKALLDPEVRARMKQMMSDPAFMAEEKAVNEWIEALADTRGWT
ncbi:MAG: hypothetical protein JNM13_05150 [Hyphomicrobiaceae bacterium]|nr:hypothetical protein [Hyphomicrobiaceae bacterium]